MLYLIKLMLKISCFLTTLFLTRLLLIIIRSNLKHLDIKIIMKLITFQHHDRKVAGHISFIVVADTTETATDI